MLFVTTGGEAAIWPHHLEVLGIPFSAWLWDQGQPKPGLAWACWRLLRLSRIAELRSRIAAHWRAGFELTWAEGRSKKDLLATWLSSEPPCTVLRGILVRLGACLGSCISWQETADGAKIQIVAEATAAPSRPQSTLSSASFGGPGACEAQAPRA